MPVGTIRQSGLRFQSYEHPIFGMQATRGMKFACVWARRMSSLTRPIETEIKIPVPWGHLAGKEWGNKHGKPVLCMHGWNDNAASFDPIAPLLDPSHHYVALETAGHGLSSHYPLGMHYHFYDNMMYIKRTANYYGWKRFSIIGHSMGGASGIWFASFFPESIDKLVTIDIVKPIILPLHWLPTETSSAIEMFLETENKLVSGVAPKSVDFDTLTQRLIDSTAGSLTKETAKILMTRGAALAKDGKGYVFTRDSRMVLPSIATSTMEDHRRVVKDLNCQMLLFKALDWPDYEPKENYEEFKAIYSKRCRKYQYVELPGSHHLHMITPDALAPYINNFLNDV